MERVATRNHLPFYILCFSFIFFSLLYIRNMFMLISMNKTRKNINIEWNSWDEADCCRFDRPSCGWICARASRAVSVRLVCASYYCLRKVRRRKFTSFIYRTISLQVTWSNEIMCECNCEAANEYEKLKVAGKQRRERKKEHKTKKVRSRRSERKDLVFNIELRPVCLHTDFYQSANSATDNVHV